MILFLALFSTFTYTAHASAPTYAFAGSYKDMSSGEIIYLGCTAMADTKPHPCYEFQFVKSKQSKKNKDLRDYIPLSKTLDQEYVLFKFKTELTDYIHQPAITRALDIDEKVKILDAIAHLYESPDVDTDISHDAFLLIEKFLKTIEKHDQTSIAGEPHLTREQILMYSKYEPSSGVIVLQHMGMDHEIFLANTSHFQHFEHMPLTFMLMIKRGSIIRPLSTTLITEANKDYIKTTLIADLLDNEDNIDPDKISNAYYTLFKSFSPYPIQSVDEFDSIKDLLKTTFDKIK